VFDRRIAKSVDADGEGTGEAVVERYVLDGDHIALTFDGDGNQTERFLHGTGIDEIIANENANGEVLWALADNQGSVRVLLDNDGNVVNQITYDAFGNITVESNPNVNFRFSYTGRELDPETGNYYYRTRFYDSLTGQFINQDTIGFAGGDSNLYRYVENNPVNYTDPFGLLKFKEDEGLLEEFEEQYNPWIFPEDDTILTPPKDIIQPGTPIQPGKLPPSPWNTPNTPFSTPPLGPWFDPTKILPDDWGEKIDDWFEKMEELIKDIKEDNEQKEEDKSSDSCPAPWASNEPQNSGDGDGQPGSDGDSGEGNANENGDAEESQSEESYFDPVTDTDGNPFYGPGYTGGDAGSASEIEPLNGKTLSEVDKIIKSKSDLSNNPDISKNKPYVTYKFKDGSRIDIRTNIDETSVPHGRITRSPAPTYKVDSNGNYILNEKGKRIQTNQGRRYELGVGEIKTQNPDGTPIPGAHDSNEFISF
jgi:RHS repeat-associated protein